MTDSSRAARYTDLFGRDPKFVAEGEETPPPKPDIGGHQHEGSECALCPICATLAVVRNARPEVLEHLSTAARELVLAATLLVEEAGKIVGVEVPPTEEEPPPANVHRLDLG